MSYRAVIFDLDGTLLDTLEDIGTAVNRVLQRKGFDPHPVTRYREFVGEGARRMIARALPVECRDEAIVLACLEEYLEEYACRWNMTTKPYNDIPGLLDALVSRGMRLAVLSNKQETFTRQCIDRFLSDWTFDAVMGEIEGMPRKPDPQGALTAAARLGIDPAEIIFVGDSGVDMKTAKSAGMFAVGVLWGYRGREELEKSGADAVIAHPMKLVELIDQANPQ